MTKEQVPAPKRAKKEQPKSPYAEANVIICKAVGRCLLEYEKADKMGSFQYVHGEMTEVRNLITDYKILVYGDFKETNKMADWLGRVAKLLPLLYD